VEQEPEQGTGPLNQGPPADPFETIGQARRSHRKKLLLIVGGVVVLLLLLGGAGYWFLLRGNAKQPAKASSNANNTNNSESSQSAANPPAAPDSTPTTYKSTKLNVELTHRKDWTLKEADGEITVTSPQISYATPTGQSTTGVFTVKIRKGVTDTMKANIEKSVAARDSVVIGYTTPTDQQRQYTNLSFAGQKESFNFFIVTGNTALKTGNTLAYTLPLDGDFYLIVGGYGADKFDSLTFDSVPKTAIDSDAEAEALKVVESLKIY
jgi:cytoskeletal protein RodZ